jgi:hypothetical protein
MQSGTSGAGATRTIAALMVLLGCCPMSAPGAADPQHRVSEGAIIRVGAMRSVRTIAEAAARAEDGDTIEIDAGDYVGDVAIWRQDRLTLRGSNGRTRLIAAGAAVDGKGIWVVRGNRTLVENIEFIGARVPDKNGAGIRFEGRYLTVRNCRFEDNENGILGGSGEAEIEIHNSQFVRNGAGDGYSHNLYVGGRRVVVRGSYFAEARVGHLIKSRAQETFVLYNRLSGEAGSSSYELEFPDGGVAMVVGNLIQQGPKTENATLVSFGAEGYRWPRNELYLSHNTLVNDRQARGVFVSARAGNAVVFAVNNVLVGSGRFELGVPATLLGNSEVPRREFADPAHFDYRLRLEAHSVGKAVGTDFDLPVALTPTEEYVHVAATKRLGRFAPANPGAFQSMMP